MHSRLRGRRFNGYNDEKNIERISEETLNVLDSIAASAASKLDNLSSIGVGALASVNAFTSDKTLEGLRSIDNAQRRSLETLSWEPAIARVVTQTDDNSILVYYICRDMPAATLDSNKRLAGRNSPAGKLASRSAGDLFEIETPGGTIAGKVIEKAILHPHCQESCWDSRNSILEGMTYGPITVLSMRAVSSPAEHQRIEGDLLASILAEEETAANVIDGIRRNVIAKMGLRDQAILDRYQDEIFRLPLNRQLLIVGPPGTGKTTTLIRRLGQKLDVEYLDDDERRLANAKQLANMSAHSDSWIMFTPTDLLKSYLKEAFARERVAARSTTFDMDTISPRART